MLKDKIKNAGFRTQRDFAVYVGKTPQTVSYWCVGKVETPKEIHALLDLIIKVKGLAGIYDEVK